MQILLPYANHGHFILFILNMEERRVYIMDPRPIPSWFKGSHPTLYYIHKIHKIANNFKRSMELANPSWKDDIFFWHRIRPSYVPKTLDWYLFTT